MKESVLTVGRRVETGRYVHWLAIRIWEGKWGKKQESGYFGGKAGMKAFWTIKGQRDHQKGHEEGTFISRGFEAGPMLTEVIYLTSPRLYFHLQNRKNT